MKNSKPKNSEYVLSAGYGLQVRIMSNGTKSWRFLQSPESGKQSRMNLGLKILAALHSNIPLGVIREEDDFQISVAGAQEKTHC